MSKDLEEKSTGNEIPKSNAVPSPPSILWNLLIPLALVAFIVISGFLGVLCWHYEYQTDDNLQKSLSIAYNEYTYSISEQSSALAGELEWISSNPQLQMALAENDSEQLLLYSMDDFERLQRVHNVTYFYFHGPDRVNILRLH